MIDAIAGILIQMKGLKTEVQVSICEPSVQLSQKLNLDNWIQKPEIETYYLENNQLEFLKQSLIVRIRVNNSKKEVEVSLKKNSPVADLSVQNNKKCEYDLHRTDKKLACKMANILSFDEYEKILKKNDLIKILNKDQKSWIKEELAEIPNDLQIAGPFIDNPFELKTKNLALSLKVTQFEQKEFIEISMRTEEESEFIIQSEIENFLKEQNVKACDDQSARFIQEKLKSFF